MKSGNIFMHWYDIKQLWSCYVSCKLKRKLELQTLIFLPSMVVISASLPMVKELVTVFPGVLEVTTKSLPFCLISVIGLMSLAIFMTSAGSSGKHSTSSFLFIPAVRNNESLNCNCWLCGYNIKKKSLTTTKWPLCLQLPKIIYFFIIFICRPLQLYQSPWFVFSHPWPWGTPRSSPGSRPAMFHWRPCFLEDLDSPSPRWAGGWDGCEAQHNVEDVTVVLHLFI